VQESVPERLELKHKVLGQISRRRAGGCDRLLHLRVQAVGAEPLPGARVIVAHPFNPVYLLPLVELVGDAADLTGPPRSCAASACIP
jgi:carnitine 3-dehydrogenase